MGASLRDAVSIIFLTERQSCRAGMGKRLFKLNGRFFYMLFSLITGERTNIAYLLA
jgi:hypothetical protein